MIGRDIREDIKETIKNIDIAISIINKTRKTREKITADRSKIDKAAIESELQELERRLNSIPKKSAILDDDSRTCPGLNSKQLTDLRDALGKSLSSAEHAIQLTRLFVEGKESTHEAKVKTQELTQSQLNPKETEAIETARKATAVDHDKMFETLQDRIVEKIQEATLKAKEIAAKLDRREMTLQQALSDLEAINKAGVALKAEVYGDYIAFAEPRADDTIKKELTTKIEEHKEQAIKIAQVLDTPLIEELKKEFTPLTDRATEAKKQSAGEALRLLEAALAEGKTKYDEFLVAKNPVTNLEKELNAFQASIALVKKEIIENGVKVIIEDANSKITGIRNKLDDAKISEKIESANDSEKLNAFADEAKTLLTNSAGVLKDLIAETTGKLQQLGIDYPIDISNVEVAAFKQSADSVDQDIKELSNVRLMTAFNNKVDAIAEEIARETIKPRTKTITELQAVTVTLREKFAELEKEYVELPKVETSKSLKAYVDAIGGKLSDAQAKFTGFDELVTAQAKLIEISTKTNASIDAASKGLEAIKTNIDELLSAEANLKAIADEFNKHFTALKNFCPKEITIEAFMGGDKDQVCKETDNAVKASVAALETYKTELVRLLEAVKVHVGLSDACKKATSTINDISLNKIEDVDTAFKAAFNLNAQIRQLSVRAKTAELESASKDEKAFKSAFADLKNRIHDFRKQRALSAISAAIGQLDNIKLHSIHNNDDKAAALAQVDEIVDGLIEVQLNLDEVTKDDSTGQLKIDKNPEVTAAKAPYLEKLATIRAQINALTFLERPTRGTDTIPEFINKMKDYINGNNAAPLVDDPDDLEKRLKTLESDNAYLNTQVAKPAERMDAKERAAHRNFLATYQTIRTKLVERIGRLKPTVVTPGAPIPANAPGSKEAIAKSKERLLRAEQQLNLVETIYENAKDNDVMQAKLIKNDPSKGCYSELNLRYEAVTIAKEELDAQERIRNGDTKIDIAPYIEKTNLAIANAEEAEQKRREYSRALQTTKEGVENQAAAFKTQMNSHYVENCIRVLEELEQKAQLLTETAYNEESVTKIETQARQLKRDLEDYQQFLLHISTEKNNQKKKNKDKIYKKYHGWSFTKQAAKDKDNLDYALRADGSLAKIESKVREARTNFESKKPERFAHFADTVEVFRDKKGVHELVEKSIQMHIGNRETVKPDRTRPIDIGVVPKEYSDFDYRVSKKTIDIIPEMFDSENSQIKLAILEIKPNDKSFYQATFRASDITKLNRIPDQERWMLILETYMQGLATGVAPDLRIPPQPKSLHSWEVDLKAVAVAYGLLDIRSFYGKEKSQIESRVKKIESAAASKDTKMPPTVKRATELDQATNTLSATTRLIPGRSS